MELPELPPLPPAVAIAVRSDRIIQTGYMREAKNTPLHTSDQMREYARQAVLAERERIIAALRDWDLEITESAHVDSFAAAIRGELR